MSTRRFRCQPESVAAARRFVRDVLSDQDREIVDAAELMACELATNCVRHAHTEFELAIHVQGEIRVEVRDTNHGQPVPGSPAPVEPSGRGLLIVEAMSDAWGVTPSSTGKTVWFALQPPGTTEAAKTAASRKGEAEDGDHPGRHISGQREPPRTNRARGTPNRARRTPKDCGRLGGVPSRQTCVARRS
jgi:anti-sigma regulatory factor (Ser/Thr protein kinase)